jgi:hypothetical protein
MEPWLTDITYNWRRLLRARAGMVGATDVYAVGLRLRRRGGRP